MSGELATPEELAAREAKAAAEAKANLSPAEALTAAHDHVSDDDLAEKIAAHPDRDIFLALWRRITGSNGEANVDPMDDQLREHERRLDAIEKAASVVRDAAG